MSPDLAGVLDFLSSMAKEGKAYRTISLYRSMLSSTLKEIDGHKIGSHPLVVRLLKGVFNLNPPRAKYTHFWDQNVVLKYLETLGRSELLSLDNLTFKLATLLALASLCRMSAI